MNQAKTALVAALGNMKPTKKFYVYFFNSGHQGLSGGGARFATRLNVATAQSWIKSQHARGMTNPSSAISDAFERIKPDTIWILTDGMFNGPGGSTAVRSMINDLNKDRMVVVNTWGFHNDPDRVDRNLGGIANDNNGTFFFSRSGKHP